MDADKKKKEEGKKKKERKGNLEVTQHFELINKPLRL